MTQFRDVNGIVRHNHHFDELSFDGALFTTIELFNYLKNKPAGGRVMVESHYEECLVPAQVAYINSDHDLVIFADERGEYEDDAGTRIHALRSLYEKLCCDYGDLERESQARIKLLEDTLRATEKELKELQAKQAADELTAEAQRLGMYK